MNVESLMFGTVDPRENTAHNICCHLTQLHPVSTLPTTTCPQTMSVHVDTYLYLGSEKNIQTRYEIAYGDEQIRSLRQGLTRLETLQGDQPAVNFDSTNR
jgi:hypothetical protein